MANNARIRQDSPNGVLRSDGCMQKVALEMHGFCAPGLVGGGVFSALGPLLKLEVEMILVDPAVLLYY